MSHKNEKQPPSGLENLPRIRRSMPVEGRALPAFIRNAGFYFTDLDVYSDGIVNAWGHLDLELFVKKLSSRWVVTSVPDGEKISIHHLASLKITNGQWDYDPQQFYEYVLEVIKDMNPDYQNLLSFFGTGSVVYNGINHAKHVGKKEGPIKQEDELFPYYRNKAGKPFNAFWKINDQAYYLCNLSVFTDRTVLINRIPEPQEVSMDQFIELANSKQVVSEVKKGDLIQIYGLGQFNVAEVLGALDIKELLGEMEVDLTILSGKPTPSDICLQFFEEFLDGPTDKKLEDLKWAYERIPDHLRLYVLGDMDNKDYAITMFIYGDEDIATWGAERVKELKELYFPAD